MGCCHVAPGLDHPLSDEENAIVTCEANLHYGRFHSSKIAQVLRDNSTNNKISENQFNTIVQTLELNISELDTVDSPMFKFYRTLRAKGTYDLSKMLVLAAMLGTGPVKEKVEILFAQLPGLEGGLAGPSSIDWMLETLFAIAVKSIPVLAVGEQPIPGKVLSHEQGEALTAKMTASIPLAKAAALKTILKGRAKIAQQDLVTCFDFGGDLSDFLKPLTLRTFIQRAEFVPK